jgi:signal recognition particle GTPase
MGDIVSIVEKAAETIEEEDAESWPSAWPRVSST